MSKLHSQLTGNEVHNPKDFEVADNSTVLSKDAFGNLEWVSKDDVGGSQGPQGIQGPAYSEAQMVIVQKNPQAGQFSSINDALASITDASSSKRYLIHVGPGTFDETATINMKQYVSVEGSGMGATVINGNFTGGHLFRASDFSSLTKMTITFPDTTRTGYALVYHENLTSGAGNRSFTVKQVHFGFSDILVKSKSTTLTCQVNVQDCNYGSIYTFNYGFVTESTASVAARIIIQGIRPVQVATPRPYALFYGSGNSCEIVVSDGLANSGGNALNGHTYAAGTLGKYGAYVENGATIRIIGGTLRGWEEAIHAANIGSAPQIDIQGLYTDRNINSIHLEHPGTKGSIFVQAEADQVTVDPAITDLTLFISDITAGDQGIVNLGKLKIGSNLDDSFDLAYVGQRQATCGIVDGGEMSVNSGTSIDIAAGRGYFKESDSPHILREVMWNAQTLNVDPGNIGVDLYVCMDETGVAYTTASFSSSTDQIVFGRVVTTAANSILILEATRVNGAHAANRNLDFLRQSLGSVYESGSTVSENGSVAHNIDIGPGFYWFGNNRFTPNGGSQISFYQHHRAAGGSGPTAWIRTLTQVVNNTQYDNGSGTLQALAAGKFVAHELYIYGCTGGANERYFLQIGQAAYDTQLLAEESDIPVPPSYFKNAVVRIARIVVQQGATNIISITPTKPSIGGTVAGGGGGGATDHGNLSGLTDDDHPQYILASGARAFTGNVSVGGNNITNVNLVDGVDVSAHASRHLPNGSDPLSTAAATSIGDANTEGTANNFARSDHKHKVTIYTLSAGEFSMQQMHNVMHSTGIVASADFLFVDNGDGTINIGTGTAFVRSSNSPTANLYHFNFAGQNNIALTNNSNNWVYLDYNAGSPAISVSTTKSTDFHSKVLLGQVYRKSTVLHKAQYARQVVGDHSSIMSQAMQDAMPFMRSMENGGGILTETGTRKVAVSAFNGWHGLQAVSIPSIDTNTSGSFSYYYNRAAWVEVTAQTQFSNSQWDNAGTLTALTAGYYRCDWVYRETDGDLVLIYGNAEHATLASAKAELRPSTVPDELEGHAILVGKIITQQGATNSELVLSAWTDQLDSTDITSHGDLANLTADDHLQYLPRSGVRAMTGSLDMGNQNITNLGSVNGTAWSETRKEQGHDMSTGAINGGALSINGDNTKYDVAAGQGYIVDNYTDPANPTITYVNWSSKTAVSPAALPTNSFTHVYINTSGNIIESTLKPTPELRRQYIYLGKVIHNNLVIIDAISNQPEVISSPLNQMADYWNGLGLVRLSGNKITPNGANLSLDKSAGFVHQMGANWHSDKKKPNVITIGAATALTFSMVTQTNNSSGNTTFLDPTSYDNAGTITSVPAGNYKAQNFRVYLFKTGTVRLQYGQTIYDSLADAAKAITTESFIVEPNLADNAVLLGIITVRRGATDLSDQDQARFFRASKFGEIDTGVASAGVVKLQGAYDNSLPSANITLDSVRGGISVKDNATPLGTDLFKVTNNGGGTEYFKVNSSGLSTSGTVNGVTVQSHASRHLPSGADPLATAAPVDTGTANSIGVAESFSKSDHVHKTVVANTSATATADTSTTSATYVLLDSMTITPAAGTYLAMFSSSGNGSATGSDMEYTIFSGGAQVTHSERNLNFGGGNNVNGTDMGMHSQAVVTVNGAQAIEVHYRVNTGTFTVHERSLILIKLG